MCRANRGKSLAVHLTQIAARIEISKIPREPVSCGGPVARPPAQVAGNKKIARVAGTPFTPLFRFAFFENSTVCPRRCPQDLWTTMNRRTRVNHVYEKAKRRV
jgi:hypothetical protein